MRLAIRRIALLHIGTQQMFMEKAKQTIKVDIQKKDVKGEFK